MTIVASVRVRDGIVLGTDSMTQISIGQQWVKSYANARKLFQLGDLPIGVMTHGLGNVGDRSIEGLIHDFCRDAPLAADVTVGGAAQALYDYVSPIYDAVLPDSDDTQALGFLIAGYSPNAAFADEFEFVLPENTEPIANQSGSVTATTWRGIATAFTSLCRGMSPGVFAELLGRGIPLDEVTAMMDQHGMTIALDGMPLQDAINFATYILDVTIGWANFHVGQASCGRPLQLAVVTPDNGWEWIAKPKLAATSARETK